MSRLFMSFMCVCVGFVHECRGHQRAEDSVRSHRELESQAVVNCMVLVLRTDLWFSARTVSVRNSSP